MNVPILRKAKIVRGKNVALRNATLADAAFILAVRTNSKAARHLSNTSQDLADQIAWLKNYANRSGEAYFIVESSTGEPLGTVRLYDPQQDSFCWGSWILKGDAPLSAAIESALLVYEYALGTLGFKTAHFQVRKENERVWAFHERFGAIRVRETIDAYEYTISNDAIRASMRRFARHLPTEVVVEV